ncbi:nudix hydrolase 10-like [Rutidosis leptorrhynchoides]|uniref:nudix hydrolase 10-like n=1 Tax=Rutidosis leptorrhynchoides TaxID=125765 RepID=UPI003A9A4045
MDQLTIENGFEKVQILPAINDHYGGVIVELKEQHMDSSVFLTRLKASMSFWTLQGKKGVWIKLPIHHVNLVETAVKEGFCYHHAEPDYLMLIKWIPKTTNTIPANASHRVGVGAIVLNDKREMLVVQEKNGVLRGSGIWKIPTGIVEEGEEISAGVIREVKEETGIDTEFVEVLAFRQWHKAFFGKSDLFFVCMMRPLSFEIQIQEQEIEAAKWMPLEEFAAQPSAHKQSLMRYIYELCIAKVDKDYSGFSPHPVTSFFSDKASHIYLNKRDLS